MQNKQAKVAKHRNDLFRTFAEAITAIQTGRLSWGTRGEMIREVCLSSCPCYAFESGSLKKLFFKYRDHDERC